MSAADIVAIGEGLYCSPLRQETPELSRLWLIHHGGISHETTEVGPQDQRHHYS